MRMPVRQQQNGNADANTLISVRYSPCHDLRDYAMRHLAQQNCIDDTMAVPLLYWY